MTTENGKVRRIVHLRMRIPATDAMQLLPFVKAAMPFYEALGGTRVRLLRNVDDPAQFIQVVEYETAEAFELNRQKLASDPMLRSYLQSWRMLMTGTAEIDVYEDITELTE